MKEWTKVLIPPTATIRKAMEIIDAGALQIALVVDSERKLLGTVTDCDIRRGILRGVSLEADVSQVMNVRPITASIHLPPDAILSLMGSRHLRHIPIVDEQGRVVRIELLESMLHKKRRNNLVVLVAGDLGTRLRPLTENCPKPTLKVGSKPILESILESFIGSGFHRFCFSVN